MKIFRVFIFSLISFLLSGSLTFCQQIPYISGAESSPFASYMNDQTPIIYKITQEPIDVTENQEVIITAEIANDIEMTDDVTTSCFVSYSLDEKEWKKVEMTQSKENEKIWVGKIPGQKKGTTIIYYLSARDTAGNLTTEVGAKNIVWPPEEEKGIYLYPSLISVSDADDPDSMAKPDLDYLEMAIGYDENYFYGKLKVQGKLEKGTESPPYIHAYAQGILNPDKGSDILNAAAIFVYSPLSNLIGEGIFGNKGYFLMDIKTIDQQRKSIEGGDEEIFLQDGTLYFRYKKAILGENPSNTMKFLGIAGAFATTDFNNLGDKIVFIDATPYLFVYLRNHSYKVK